MFPIIFLLSQWRYSVEIPYFCTINYILFHMDITPVARFRSPFSSKFGIPKQSGIIASLRGSIEFESPFRNPDALRGIDSFDYLWLIWEFSANPHAAHGLLVRPPRLGGNERVGVFASRSPFRPNGLGLSSVRLSHVEWDTPRGPVLHVLGADLMDGTPIYDIKPYVVYADSHPEARSGFVDTRQWTKSEVILPAVVLSVLRQAGWSDELVDTLVKVLEQDPRPRYQQDSARVYGMPFAGYDIHFRCQEGKVMVTDAVPL